MQSSAPLGFLKNIFGQPREGVHGYRLFGLAAVDLFATAGLAKAVTWSSKWETTGWTFLGLVLAGCAVHALCGVDASLNRFLIKFG